MSDSYTKPLNPLRAPHAASKPRGAGYVLHNYIGARWLAMSPYAMKLPMLACCYVFFFDGVAVYVGQTSNLRERMSDHRRGILTQANGRAVSMKVHPGYRYGDWMMREVRLIRRLRPIFNRNGVLA